MPIIVIRIADLLLDDTAPGEDLALLPEDVLVERIKSTFSAISSLADVRLADGMAFIEFDEETERKGVAARKQIHDAGLLASTGKYQPAIRLYEQGLAVLPTHTEGRRGLAMAQMELGLYAAAIPSAVMLSASSTIPNSRKPPSPCSTKRCSPSIVTMTCPSRSS